MLTETPDAKPDRLADEIEKKLRQRLTKGDDCYHRTLLKALARLLKRCRERRS